jgi:hypothetical protein
MFKKIILILFVGILTIQTFPTEWLSSMLNKNICIELISESNNEEEADEDALKNFKIKIIEVDILDHSRNYYSYSKKSYLNYIDLIVFNYSKEVICPPPNFI